MKFGADGKSWFIGSAGYRKKADGEFVSKAAEWQDNGLGVVAASCDGSPVALFCVEDRIQPGVAEAIRSMKDKGIEVAMITGDKRSAAGNITARAGISEVYAEMMPSGKLEGGAGTPFQGARCGHGR